MTVETPTINRIIRLTEFDLLRTNIHKFDMYICLDSQKMYYDETDTSRVVYNYIGIKTVNDLMYYTTPEFGRSYYCWEDNTLWTWVNKWISIYSDGTYPSGYVYSDWNGSTGYLNSVYRYDQPLMPADDNGLLHDGSVVIRDAQRIIKGKLYVDSGNDNLVISSFLGGGVRFLPNGLTNTDGELFISDEADSFLRSKLTIKNNEIYVNYSESPVLDPANGTSLEKQDHNYKVFHEGNLDASLVRALTGEMVYNALITDKSQLPNPFDFNVNKISGKTINDISLVGHTHTSEDITDFVNASQTQAYTVFNTLFTNNITTEGITITSQGNNTYKLSANNFNLKFTGGATGNGTITHLGNTSINLTVDPTEHVHSNYISRMDSLQQQINDIAVIDINDYYTKRETNELLQELEPTNAPTPGKALKVNNSGILPVTSASANKLSNTKHISLTGDITGSIDTDFENSNISISTSALNILSNTPTQGKALAVDANGDLPGNASTASQLNHTITLSLTGEASGSSIIDTSTNTASLQVTLVPGNNILQTSDLNTTIPTLDNSGKIPTSQIPTTLLETTLKPQGTFNPTQGVPSQNPTEGYFWTATTDGIIGTTQIEQNDLYVYLNGVWQVITSNNRVTSVNGQTGRINISSSDVGGISTSYIDYTVGTTVPANKIPLTSSNGVLPGVTVSALTNTHSFTTTGGDVQVNVNNSTRTATDGSQNFDVQLDITQTGYNNIITNAGITLQRNGTDLSHKPKLNFSSDFIVQTNTNDYTIKLGGSTNEFNWIYVDPDLGDVIDTTTTQGRNLIETIQDLYSVRTTKPLIIVRGIGVSYGSRVDSDFNMYMINDNLPNLATTQTLNINALNTQWLSYAGTSSYMGITMYHKDMVIITDSDSQITQIKFMDNQQVVLDCLPITTASSATPFIPTLDAQPASKKYVDNAIGGISGTKYKTVIGGGTNFTITHNLGTRDLIVQFRDNNTHTQVLLDNEAISDNEITVSTDGTALSTDQITVLIIAI